MKQLKFWIFLVVSIGLLLDSSLIIGGVVEKTYLSSFKSNNPDDFYFVHITDTHVVNKLFDRNEVSKKRFTTVIEKIISLNPKPAFVVLTGDIVEWGGSDVTGAMNYQTLLECLYEQNDQLYIDDGYTIPLYTTPGNHDYMSDNSLENYHTYIDKNHVIEGDRYIVTLHEVSLFFMDSGFEYILEPWDYSFGSGLYDGDIEWLEDTLSECTSKHKIILMHHPAINFRDIFGVMIDVIARNRENFIDVCLKYDVDLVLAGHTHDSIVFDSDENKIGDLPLKCSEYSTLFVQTDDCKQGINYRIISYVNGDILLEETEEIENPPEADAGGPYNAEEGTEVIFNASDSHDPDGDVLLFIWDFDGDEVWDTVWSHESHISYSYGDDYEGIVNLAVTDETLTDFDHSSVLISNVAPTGDAGPDQTVNEGDVVFFDLTYIEPSWLDFTNSDCDFDIGGDRKLGKNLPRFVEGDNVWWDNRKGWNQLINLTTGDEDFNDFKILVREGEMTLLNYHAAIWTITPSGSHFYGKTWNYSTGGVRDHNVVDVFKVAIQPGEQGYFRAEYQMTINGKVMNEGELRIDPPKEDSFSEIIDTEVTSIHPVEFTYEDCGTYILKYYVSDDDDGFSEDTCTITVLNLPPEITPFGPFTGKLGESIEISATATDAGSDDLTFSWDFGDGTSIITNIYYNNGNSPDTEGDSFHGISPFSVTDTVEHTYDRKGTYSVKLTVEDDNGGINEYSTSASVPRNKPYTERPFLRFLQNFLGNHPIFYQLFQRVLRL